MSIKKNNISKHSFFLKLALVQAKKKLGNTKENPSVGCIIVKKNNIISAGSTSFNGRPHAENNAISFAKRNINGSDIYITLEPCAHYGKTSPCVDTIIKHGIKRVYFSIKDPDIRSYNKSSILFKKKGVTVKHGINFSKINYFYRSYFKYKKEKLPFVTAKIAISKDYYTINKKRGWITNNFSRSRVHLLRSMHDCIVTSSKTIIKDNSNLTCRILGLENESPTRVILDKKLSIPVNSNVFKNTRIRHTIIFYNKFNKKKFDKLKKLGVKLFKSPLFKDGNLNLKSILYKVKVLGFSRIFLESGLKLTTNFLANNLVDDFYLFISNKKLGKNGANNIKKYIKSLLKNKKLINEKVNLKGEKLVSYKIK